MNLNALKYKFIRWLFNFPKFRAPQRGFIIIQIDGLSFETFKKALNKNYLPKIKKILKKNYNYKKFLSGIPSNTPYFQKVLFYGDLEKYPGFRWYDKKLKKYFSFKLPETAEIEEKKIKDKNFEGILKNGASYFNLFSGDASRAYLTLSQIFKTDLKTNISAFKLFTIILLNIPALIKVVFWSIVELFNEIFDFLFYKLSHLPQRDFKFYPFLRIFNNVVINEYITQGAMVEVICGTPKIYITYNAYDEAAHQRGVISKSSLNILRLIDKSVWRIFKLSQNKKNFRKYDFFILSDHGQIPSIPFSFIFRKNFEDIIHSYKEKISTVGEEKETHILSVIEKIKNLSRKKKIPRFIYNLFPDLENKKYQDIEIHKDSKIKIINFGTFSQIYFTDYQERLAFEDINEKFPLILLEILSHKSVKFLSVVDKDNNVIFLGKNGFLKVKNDKIIDFSGDLPFEKKFIKELNDLTLCEKAGDILIFGNIINGKIVNFEGQLTAHGTFYDDEMSCFILYPKYREKFIKKVNKTYDLHIFFKNTYV